MNKIVVTREHLDNAKTLLDRVSQIADQSKEGLEQTSNIINSAASVFLESKRLDNENLTLKKEIASIVSDFKLRQSTLQAIFAERSQVINKHMEAIDKGLRENNDQLVLEGLKSAGAFVATNPLDNFDTFRAILRDKNAPLDLDF